MKFPAFLEDAFTTGYTSKDADGDVFIFELKDLGAIKISDGRLFAFDPLALSFEEPFAKQFPKGSFMVQLAVATINGKEKRTGLARVKFSEDAPKKWEMALVEGQDPKELDGDDFFGFEVDSGTAAFMDVRAYEEWEDVYSDEQTFNAVNAALNKNFVPTCSHLLWEGKKSNGAFFTTGYGDGLFGCYIGYDAKGKVCRLVCDCGLLGWE